jgi:hypothetical protein
MLADLASTTQLVAAMSIPMTNAAKISHRSLNRNWDGRTIVTSVVATDAFLEHTSPSGPSHHRRTVMNVGAFHRDTSVRPFLESVVG